MQSTAVRPKASAPEDSQTGRTLLNLRAMLLRGDFRPGDRISELPLVARLGVSRTPIRLALDRLANEGLLKVSPTGGFVVRAFSVEDVWDAIETRGVLEGAAARLAAERLQHPDELISLRVCLAEMDAQVKFDNREQMEAFDLNSFARHFELNETFHSGIVMLSKSPMLRRTLDQIMLVPFASPSSLVYVRNKLPHAPQLFTIAQDHHHSILDAIERRQGTRAEAVAREHARMSRRNIELALADIEILNGVPGASLIQRPATAS